MKKFTVFVTVVLTVCFIGSLAFGNPALLPKHPGYPMADSKDPVLGVRTANDPGEKTPSPQESLKASAEFDAPRAINYPKEEWPNVVVPKGESASGS